MVLKKDIAKKINKEFRMLDHKKAKAIVDRVFEIVTDELYVGKKIRISGLLYIYIDIKKGMDYYDVYNKKRMRTKPKWSIIFKISPRLKKRIESKPLHYEE